MDLLEKISGLAKRRGFVYPGSEIYGGLGGFYDFGPLGVEMKFNIKQAWWEDNVRRRDDVLGLSAAILMNPRVWEASGHVSGFSDWLIECKGCHTRYKVDDLNLMNGGGKVVRSVQKYGEFLKMFIADPVQAIKDFPEEAGNSYWKCGGCGEGNDFPAAPPRKFNLMFKTFVGAVEDKAGTVYLRPETAGGIFANFKNVLDTNRVKIPFGIAQIGKAFRNEINPKDFVFRTREFEQMELEYFVRPGEDKKAFKEWVRTRVRWYEKIGLKNIREREQPAKERAHYSKETVDIEYKFPFGSQEIEGIANRGDFDLSAHMKASGADLNYFDEETKEKYVPYVIEPSAGVERIMLALLCDAYGEEGGRVVLRFHPRIAPYKVAVFPLLANKPKLTELARKIYEDLKVSNCQLGNIAWDDRGNIGKRYYSQDEIGTPFCVTVDFESLEKDDVTVRDRDSMKQVRVKIGELKEYLREKLAE